MVINIAETLDVQEVIDQRNVTIGQIVDETVGFVQQATLKLTGIIMYSRNEHDQAVTEILETFQAINAKLLKTFSDELGAYNEQMEQTPQY